MSLTGVISITGKPGLFKVVSQTKNGLVVESLTDGKRMPVYASQRVSAIEDISIYTYDDDVPLKDVYFKMYEVLEQKEGPSHKEKPEVLSEILRKALEDFDEDRVYNSDLKKLFQWYNILVKNDLIKEDEESSEETDAEVEESSDNK